MLVLALPSPPKRRSLMDINSIITLSDDSIGNTKEIAGKLRNNGFQIASIFEFGVITGVASEENLLKISTWPEVKSITKEKQIHILPPDENIQ